MSAVPLEYKVMKKKLYKALDKGVGEDLEGVIVFGGSASDRIFSGVSDVDFLIVLKSITELSKPLAKVYEDISNVLMEFLENPLFSSLLDFEIYVMDQIPVGKELKGFSPIKALCLAEGELLQGNNPFEGMKITKKVLKDGARRMIQEYLDKLTSLLFMTRFDMEDDSSNDEEGLEAEKDFLATDAILSSTQALKILNSGAYVNMPTIVLKAEIEPTKGLDNELIVGAGKRRQGVEIDIDDYYNRAINHVSTIITMVK